jgi:hypothetical protein
VGWFGAAKIICLNVEQLGEDFADTKREIKSTFEVASQHLLICLEAVHVMNAYSQKEGLFLKVVLD